MTLQQPPRNQWRQHALVLIGYALVAVVFTWPLLPLVRTHLPGPPDGDTGVYVWNQWVFQHEVLDHRTLPYFTGEIFAATGRANLSLHNYTAFANILALPFVRSLGVVVTFNLVYLALTILTAYATFLLARRLTEGNTAVAWLTGALFAWSPVLVTRGMGHFSLIGAAPLPIFVLQLIRMRSQPSVREAATLGAIVAWATACDVYYGVYCVMMATTYLAATSFRLARAEAASPPRAIFVRSIDLVAISLSGLVLALLLSQGWQFTVMGQVVRVRTVYTPIMALTLLVAVRLWLHFRPTLRPVSLQQIGASLRVLATTGVVAAILMSPLLYAFGLRVLDGRVDRSTTFWRSSPPGIDLLALVTPNPNHPAAPAVLREWLSHLTRDGYLENVASIPLVALAVVLVAWRTGRHARAGRALAIGFGVLALGPFVRIAGIDTHIPAPWALLRYVPILGLTRSPGRFFVPAMLGIAVLFAIALRTLLARWPGVRTPALAGAAALLLVELFPAPRPVFSAEIPSIYRIVASDPREGVRVLELPFGIRDGRTSVGNFTARTQYYQTAHGKPIIGGYLSRVSRRRVRDNQSDPVLRALVHLSEGRPLSPEQLAEFRSLWPGFVRRTSLGYVVLDRKRAPDQLQSVAVTDLQLEKLADDDPLVLYRPTATP
ncbi:MAG: hypothetical protein A3H97_23410 [Acidobacteria bacterium RIFCSPLOWO2_02_FULL_65_29]|nr:MAG: hypothetical protein A3H97_23410 [Acidobacteria bacterium RIFCSPLOWO2_02_FULL_65_29]